MCARVRPRARARVCFLRHLSPVVYPAEAARTDTHAALGNPWLCEEWSCGDLFQSDCFDPAASLQPVMDHPCAQSDREREISLAEWQHSNSAICIMNFKLLNPRPALFLHFVPRSFSGAFFLSFFSSFAAAACSRLIAGRHSGRTPLWCFYQRAAEWGESSNCVFPGPVNPPPPPRPPHVCPLTPTTPSSPLPFVSSHSAFFLVAALVILLHPPLSSSLCGSEALSHISHFTGSLINFPVFIILFGRGPLNRQTTLLAAVGLLSLSLSLSPPLSLSLSPSCFLAKLSFNCVCVESPSRRTRPSYSQGQAKTWNRELQAASRGAGTCQVSPRAPRGSTCCEEIWLASIEFDRWELCPIAF